MKKILAVCLAAVMCLSLLPMTALAAGLSVSLEAPMNPSAVIREVGYNNWGNEMIYITADIPDSVQPYLPEKYGYVNTFDDGTYYSIVIEVDWSVNSLNDWNRTDELMWADRPRERNNEVWLDGGPGNIGSGLKGETSITNPLLFSNNVYQYGELYNTTDMNAYGKVFKDNITINLRARYKLKVGAEPGYTDEPDFTYYSDWTPVFQAVRANDNIETQNPIEPTEKPSTWAEEQVNAAISNNLVPQDLQAKYTQATTRAEFAALAVTLYEQVTGTTITERKTFDDTTDINVEKAAAIGVVSGVGDNKFDPNAGLTREQAATMLSRLANATGKPLTQQAAAFNDNGSISSWALEAVGQMQASGIMGGVGNNTFDPKGAYTREQSIITIMRLYDVLKGNTGGTNNTAPSGVLNGTYQWTGYDGNNSADMIWVYVFKSDGTVTHSQDYAGGENLYNASGTYTINGDKVVTTTGHDYFGITYNSANDTIAVNGVFGDRVFEKVK